MAFFQERVIPTERPRRRTLPVTWMMLTAATWTFLLANASSTACLIWILFAPGATSKMYLPWSPRSVLFSETTGRRMVLYASSVIRRRPPHRALAFEPRPRRRPVTQMLNYLRSQAPRGREPARRPGAGRAARP